jgi:hypothetical protein
LRREKLNLLRAIEARKSDGSGNTGSNDEGTTSLAKVAHETVRGIEESDSDFGGF